MFLIINSIPFISVDGRDVQGKHIKSKNNAYNMKTRALFGYQPCEIGERLSHLTPIQNGSDLQQMGQICDF